MGLQTATTTEDPQQHNQLKSFALLEGLNSTRPNVSSLGKMAPALTEPLSPANKLSSAASQSPRPSSNKILLLSDSNATSSNKAFQLAFEKSVNIVKTASTDTNSIYTYTQSGSGSNGSKLSSKSQMGPMFDSNTIVDSKHSSIAIESICQPNIDEAPENKFVNLVSDFEEAISAEIGLPSAKNQDFLTHMECTEVSSDEQGSPIQQKSTKNLVHITSIQELPRLTSLESVVAELPRVNTDSTVTASECDHIEESLSQLDASDEQHSIDTASQTPPPTSCSLQQSPGAAISSLNPQSTSSNMGLQKDFIKDAAEMDQVLGDMDLLQVLKGFDSTPGGEALCDLAGSLGLFNDVDVITNYEEIVPVKDSETIEIQNEIEKKQALMHRKVDFLIRRLRKLQARYMSKQTSEEVAGLFEWTGRIARRKDHDVSRQLTYDEDKHRPVTATSMRAVLTKIDSIASTQHTSPYKKNKVGRPSHNATPSHDRALPLGTVVPTYDEKATEEMLHISGLLQTEMREVQSALDSDVTASSSGGESADEYVTYNNEMQQTVTIAKRAAWRYARDRASIASRWTWLISQISDLEYKIRQHTDLYNQIRKLKGPVKCGDILSDTQASFSVNGYRGGASSSKSAYEPLETTPSNDAGEQMSDACRTRPFQRSHYRKRKLLQTANIHTVSKKAARPSTIKCGCQWPLQPCALCTGRSDPTAPRDLPDTMLFAERVALLDPGFHPVLSFPEDVPNSIHIEATARLPEWQTRVARCTAKSAIKGAIAAQKAADRAERLQNSTSTAGNKKAADGRKKYSKKKHSMDFFMGEGGAESTPLMANKLKNSKKQQLQQHPYQQQPVSHQQAAHQRSFDQYNHHQAHSSSTSHHHLNSVTKNKIRKVSSSTTTFNGSQIASGIDYNGFPLDNLDGAINGIVSRSRNSSPTNNISNSYKSDRTFERKNRNSYDIDNIVIPYSVAAATRVEILPYKEIPTPKWRVVGDDEDEDDTDSDVRTKTKCKNTIEMENQEIQNLMNQFVESPSKENSSDKNEGCKDEETKKQEKASESSNDKISKGDACDILIEDVSLLEDISNEAIQFRHDRALIEERRKFQTFLKFPYSTRSRANRRIDSRAESSGTNTPDPTSPAPNTPSLGGDQESIPSPAGPSTPQTPLEHTSDPVESSICNPPPISSILSSLARRNERKRTVSTKKEKDIMRDEQRRSCTPDLKEIIPPFEPLKFPLTDEEFESMLKVMPDDHHTIFEDCLKPEMAATTPETETCDDEKLLNNNTSTYKKGNKFSNCTNTIDGNGGEGETTDSLLTNSAPVGHLTGDGDEFSAFNDATMSDLASRHGLLGDSDSESLESGQLDDDPNDPEWKEEPE